MYLYSRPTPKKAVTICPKMKSTPSKTLSYPVFLYRQVVCDPQVTHEIPIVRIARQTVDHFPLTNLDMTTANNPSPWNLGQIGRPSVKTKVTRDLSGYVTETTNGCNELVDALVFIAGSAMPNVPVQ